MQLCVLNIFQHLPCADFNIFFATKWRLSFCPKIIETTLKNCSIYLVRVILDHFWGCGKASPEKKIYRNPIPSQSGKLAPMDPMVFSHEHLW